MGDAPMLDSMLRDSLMRSAASTRAGIPRISSASTALRGRTRIAGPRALTSASVPRRPRAVRRENRRDRTRQPQEASEQSSINRIIGRRMCKGNICSGLPREHIVSPKCAFPFWIRSFRISLSDRVPWIGQRRASWPWQRPSRPI